MSHLLRWIKRRRKKNVDGAIIGIKLTCTLSCVGDVLDKLMKINIVAKTKKETFPTIEHKKIT